MHGKHRDMWQYIIDHVDDIFQLYADTMDEEWDPQWIITQKKHEVVGDGDILHLCYACQQCEGACVKCPIIHKAGCCCSEEDSAYVMVLKAITEGDKELFIKEARRLRDAWE